MRRDRVRADHEHLAAVDELVRRGLAHGTERSVFVQRTSAGGARLELHDVAGVLGVLDGPAQS